MATPTLPHTDYPHVPGALYDCQACESECYCEGNGNCVYCAILAEAYGDAMEDMFDPDADPYDTLAEWED